MSKHLAILKGPQGERLSVICASEEEARALEARKRKVEHAIVEEETTCPTCGQEIVDDEELAEEEKENNG
jgi:hypothetical protein